MSIVTFRVSDEEKDFLQNMSELKGVSLSELARDTILSTLENQIDIEIYERALNEHRQNDQSISHEEMKRELGLWGMDIPFFIFRNWTHKLEYFSSKQKNNF